jgi:hypothetical protein
MGGQVDYNPQFLMRGRRFELRPGWFLAAQF